VSSGIQAVAGELKLWSEHVEPILKKTSSWETKNRDRPDPRVDPDLLWLKGPGTAGGGGRFVTAEENAEGHGQGSERGVVFHECVIMICLLLSWCVFDEFIEKKIRRSFARTGVRW